ncbi:ABC transporter permease [Fulvivirgaceae bacterium BMA10]|uniref:ABC transporter permease n=1 Tax=Splendidivirga corallicola TaxID=3051826 RepID=A0ABT8KNQ1_9BACT|nr:ABC transporter permease [Fulvivirgaceae bacterium BMA10]
MLKNYLRLAIRNLFKRKLYSFINIFGLAIGMAACLVILKYVEFELSFDNFHKNGDNVYRTVTTSYGNGELRGTFPLSGFAQGPSLVADIPEFKTFIRTHPMYGGAVFNYQDKRFFEEEIFFVDSTFLHVFTYEMLRGNEDALMEPSSMVITETMAEKYFGPDIDPIGKTLNITGGWADGDYKITGMMKDVPGNSHLQFDFLLSFNNLFDNRQYQNDDGWGWNNFITYVELYPNADLNAVHEKLITFIDKYQGEQLAESNSREVLKLQPIKDIHLSPGMQEELSATTSINTIYFFAIVAFFILAIAWVNYINLSTAKAMERAREVGIKKAIGAYRHQLITQFLFESMLVNLISVVIAILMVMLALPLLGDIVDKDLTLSFGDAGLWLFLVGLFALGSLISGTYPAFVLSSFKTTIVIKGQSGKSEKGISLRKLLVVFQFAASLLLVAGTFSVYRQIDFMRNQDKGMNMEQMLIVKGPSIFERENLSDRIQSLKNELKTHAAIVNVATSGTIPGAGFNWGTSMRKDGTELKEERSGNVTWVDPDFIDTYGIELLSGTSWNPDKASDMEKVLINEMAIATFGLGDVEKALEERIIIGDDTIGILGVLKNYHWNSLKSEHVPVLLAPSRVSRSNISIHLNTNNIQNAIALVKEQYDKAFPGNVFEYYFLDEFFNRQYRDDQQFAEIFSLFALFAILIACLGLWALASFTISQRLKEIGIRKVLGASTTNIMSLLSKQFLMLMLIACLVAIPLTWFGVKEWLDSYAFKINIAWDLFVIPVLLLMLISLITVSFHIVKGANTNPATTLRSE